MRTTIHLYYTPEKKKYSLIYNKNTVGYMTEFDVKELISTLGQSNENIILKTFDKTGYAIELPDDVSARLLIYSLKLFYKALPLDTIKERLKHNRLVIFHLEGSWYLQDTRKGLPIDIFTDVIDGTRLQILTRNILVALFGNVIPNYVPKRDIIELNDLCPNITLDNNDFVYLTKQLKSVTIKNKTDWDNAFLLIKLSLLGKAGVNT